MSLAALMEPAIVVAENGFQLTSFQRASIEKYLDDIRSIEPLNSLVLDSEGEVLPAGARIRLPGLASTLRRIADGGVDEFYRGSIAAEIEADMIRRHGFVRRADLALVRARELSPYRGTYRGFEVLAFPAPGAGGAVIESLNLLECHSPETLQRDDVTRLQLMAESFHIANEDDRAHAPDPNLPQLAEQPVHLDKAFAASRAALIVPGRPVPAEAFQARAFRPSLESQTVHVSVIDEHGNAVSLTQTLGRFFGNKIVAHELGFLYNVLLGGLDPGNPAQIRPMAIHSLDGAPTIILADGKPLLVLGSAGSSRIPGAVATVVSNVIDRGLPLADAVAAPRALWSLGDSTRGFMLEIAPPVRAAHARALESMGYQERFFVDFPALYQDVSKFGGVNAILRDPETGRLTGVGDPRRIGDARGL
jgi:gamma-glutamyltranspeptidase/glutathione hydrolase